MRTQIAMLCVGLCASSSPAVGQTALYFEAGGARVRYGDTVQVTAGTLSAAASALTPNTSFSGLIAASTTQQSSWTMFGSAQGSVLTPARRLLRGELLAAGALSTYGAGSGSGHLLGGARVHIARQTAGAWLGATAGSVKDPIGWRSTSTGEIGAWLQIGPSVAQMVVLPVRIAGGLRYTNAEGTIRFDNSRLELIGVAGVRTAIKGYDESPDPWASVNATAWLLRTVGITAGIGSYPSDPGQDLPAAKYVTLGVRISPKSMRRSPALLSADVLTVTAREAPPAMTVTNGPSGRRTISFHALSARGVEIMGDFTDWAPMQMTAGRFPGSWVVSLPISSGVHQVNVRVDGGQWAVPAGLTAVRDEFGGSVGILLIP